MAVYKCDVCSYLYDEEKEGRAWEELPADWVCPVCGAPKSAFSAVEPAGTASASSPVSGGDDYLGEWRRTGDDKEAHMADIHRMAETGESIIEPMRTAAPNIGWDQILIKGAQLETIPLNADEPVTTATIIGPRAAYPLRIETPLYITHMSFGALSRETKIALARGSARVKTAMCSGEGGILPEEMQSAYKYIFEYVPNRYSVTDENLRAAAAIEIKIGQSAKPGLGGHLPGRKVTAEIAAVRGFPEGQDIISPARFDDIANAGDLKRTVEWLREKSGGKPVGIKFAAGNVEGDLAVAVSAGPDFITIDGRAGGTGASPKFIKAAASVPTLFALRRARKFLDTQGATDITLVITGGLRVSSDFAKALAMGANAVAIGTAAMIAAGCQQYRICETGRCPVGVTTHDPELRARFDIEASARRVANFLTVCTEELREFARMTGNSDVHGLSMRNICTINSEISGHTDIEHV